VTNPPDSIDRYTVAVDIRSLRTVLVRNRNGRTGMSATVESIPVDQCICGTRRRKPLPNCWAATHDFELDAAHTHYRGLLGRLEDANPARAAQGHPPLSRRAVEHDLSLASYDRALGEGRH
jgi:hypothetical protein